MHHRIDSEDPADNLERAISYLARSRRVTVLTGAGVSAESGVATFRGASGLWEGHRIADVATPEGFQRDPTLVWRFYNQRRVNLASVQPNAGHYALASLEQRLAEGNFALVTQNVDGLHRAAGSCRVLELHGNLRRVRCTGCGTLEDRNLEPLGELPHCPACSGLLRPDVVWFGEILPQDIWIAAEEAAKRCDCFLVVGTSAVVYPAAGLIMLAKDHGARVIEVNLQQTDASAIVDAGLYGPSGQILPKLVDKALRDS
jgi:NAD-dependent deacetylase